MLPPKHRLQKQKDFDTVYKRGRTLNGPLFNLRFLARDGDSRFGFVIGSKLEKKATRRNLVKRRFRAVVGELLPNIKSGFDVVILIRAKALSVPYSVLKEEVGGMFKKARMTNF